VNEAFRLASEAFLQASEAMRLVLKTLRHPETAEPNASEKSTAKKKKKQRKAEVSHVLRSLMQCSNLTTCKNIRA
jgi:hypothetical protein